MPIGPTGPRFHPIQAGTVRAGLLSAAGLTTALTGANNDLTYTAPAGAAGNAKTVAYVNNGVSQALAVTVAGDAISVSLATDAGGVITSTATQVADAVNAAAAGVTATNAPDNTGAGVVTTLAATPLSGGASYSFGRGR